MKSLATLIMFAVALGAFILVQRGGYFAAEEASRPAIADQPALDIVRPRAPAAHGARLEDGVAEEASGTLTLPGLVTASRVPVRAQVPGLLTELPVREGQSVREGELLARIDDAEMKLEVQWQAASIKAAQLRVEAAQQELAVAKDDLERNQQLSSTQAVSSQSLVASRLRLQAQTAQVAALKEQLVAERCRLKLLAERVQKHRAVASFAGVVTDVLRQPGTFAQPGEILLHVEANEKQVMVQVPTGMAADPKKLEFTLLMEGRRTPLPVARVKPSSNPDGSRTVLLQMPTDTNLETGQMVQVQLSQREAQP